MLNSFYFTVPFSKIKKKWKVKNRKHFTVRAPNLTRANSNSRTSALQWSSVQCRERSAVEMGSGTLSDVVRRMFQRRSSATTGSRSRRNDTVKQDRKEGSEFDISGLKLIQVPERTFFRLVSADTHKLVSKSILSLPHKVFGGDKKIRLAFLDDVTSSFFLSFFLLKLYTYI